MSTRESPVTGGCLCGAIRYRITGPLGPVIGCHCEQCRRTSGHYAASTDVATDDLLISNSKHALKWYRSSETAERGFCQRCGSNLFWRQIGGDRVAVGAGSLDHEQGMRMDRHVFVNFKGDYYEIPDDAQTFPLDDDETIA
ncbi:GFA family protein [Hwanghaeella sp.]|uniref:GFA family protein n=1 Tax=Hwanghaeella sp. TaxID=2605943 RepID=UPI003CCBBBF0